MDSSSIAGAVKNRVFLNFRGKDARGKFIQHLHEAMGVEGIETFIDDDINKGDELETLFEEIKESKFLVAVVSEHYANSRWCLDELVTMLECKNKYGHILIPVFYGVKKTDVETQSGKFGEAFAEIKKNERYKDKISIWESALAEVARLTGWDSGAVENERALVEKIVSDVIKRLKDISTSDNKDGFGLNLRVQKLEELLSGRPEVTCTLGLWGDPGMGKTTLARAIFEKISSRFEVSHFVENVGKRLKGKGQTRLLRELGTKMGDKTVPKKVLVVFDDVTDSTQIDFLLRGLFNGGSLIIIVARYKSVLDGCSVDVDYKVERLRFDEALMLFKWCVYGKNNCTDDYRAWSKQMVECANYGPLALKVLGSCLLCKIKKDWERVLQKLSDYRPLDIYKVLRIGYEELVSEEQELFKKIVGRYAGEDVDEVKSAFKRLNFKSVDGGIKVLEQRSLISIVDNKIVVHDLIKEMCERIPRKRRRVTL